MKRCWIKIKVNETAKRPKLDVDIHSENRDMVGEARVEDDIAELGDNVTVKGDINPPSELSARQSVGLPRDQGDGDSDNGQSDSQ